MFLARVQATVENHLVKTNVVLVRMPFSQCAKEAQIEGYRDDREFAKHATAT